MKRSAPAGTFRKIALLVVVIILYGSLYPFHLSRSLSPGDALMLLRDSWRNGAEANDFAINVVFYMPLGFCLFRGLPISRLARTLVILVAGLALSTTVELIQSYEEDRYSSLWDILANCSGTMLGVLLSEILTRRWIARPFVTLLLIAWTGSVCLQPMPACSSNWAYLAGSQMATALAVGLLLAELLDDRGRRMLPPVIIAAVLAAGSLVQKSVPCASLIAGTAIALILWITVLWKDSGRNFALYLVCAGGVVLQRLQPLHFTSTAHAFEWLPFLGLILAPPKACLLMVLSDTFSLGVLIWLIMRAGIGRHWAIVAGSSATVLVLFAKCFMPETASEISDLIILWGLAWTLVFTGEEAMISDY